MLIFTRRIGETTTIGNDVKAMALNARGDQVRIGVVAPRAVPMHREKIYERIQRETSR